MERSAFATEFPFEVRTDDFALSRGFGSLEDLAFVAIRMPEGMGLVPGPEVVVVRDQTKLAAGLDHTMERFHCGILDDSSLVMPGLGPRIAEVEMDDSTAPVGKTVANDLGCVIVQHADVRQRASSNPVRGESEELPSPLDTEEVGLLLQLRLLDEECPLPRSDLEFEWTVWMAEEDPRIPVTIGDRRQIVTKKSEAIEVLLSSTTQSERHHSFLPRSAGGMRGVATIQSPITSIAFSSMVMSMIPYSSGDPFSDG